MEREGPGDSPRDASSICFKETSSSGTELNILMDSVVSSQSMLFALSISSSVSREDSVQEGSTSDRFVHISVIVVNVFSDDLLKTKLCYVVFILSLLIVTVAAAAAVL